MWSGAGGAEVRRQFHGEPPPSPRDLRRLHHRRIYNINNNAGSIIYTSVSSILSLCCALPPALQRHCQRSMTTFNPSSPSTAPDRHPTRRPNGAGLHHRQAQQPT
ncbi:uncharacterized protein BO66DRAFT_188491 [Aspergillus aculeatinus CBS 121060]|uniref:Uncharacterized protein n=1 Tax=Aspergillus aculeatinus CBS 121060 TaxID=1448322 RepID=A0ACD1GXY6_9EURO|nr:hypothetical protein BO66DRAFT_188491 [Aspergillus aculeatinus CBS 121060]RAH66118.1 hypothetical protein BO66DRAFT_188491 [Aspergillus aculeatinus CBS 121060]